MHVRKVTLILIYLVSVLVSFVVANKDSNKRMPGPTHSFQQMIRYGRSGDKDGKIQVYPRAHVFYLGPRYGKRSGTNAAHADDLESFNNDETVSCTYTGVTNLYRCNPARRPFESRI